MAETLGMASLGVGAAAASAGMTTMRHGAQSETTSKDGGGVGYTPSIMSPIKHAMGLGLGGADTTLYSVPSPIRMQAIHDPVREVDENMREQQELLERKLKERRLANRRDAK
jgi:hypothetical protein